MGDNLSLQIIRAIAEGGLRAQQLWNEAVNSSLQNAFEEARHNTISQQQLDAVAPTVRFSKRLNISQEQCAIC